MTEPNSPTTFVRPTFALMRFLQADNLLQGTPVLERLTNVQESLGYPLIDPAHLLSPVEALHELQRQVAAIPGIRLKQQIAPGEENSYSVDLTLSYELVLNQVQRVSVLSTAFLGHLRAVYNRITRIASIFNLWWIDGAEEVMEGIGRSKQKTEKALAAIADDEFSTAMQEKDVEVAAVIEATVLLIANLKATLKLATETYQLGRDQINVALTDNIVPNSGIAGRSPSTLARVSVASGTVDTLRQVFGDRVQTSVAPSSEDDLQQAVAPGVMTPEALADAPDEPELPMDSGSQPAQEPVPEPTQEPEKAPLAEPVTAKSTRKQGDPLTVITNLNLAAPGLSGKVDGVIVRKCHTKLLLTGQTNPSENGVYRFMGADQPLELITATQGSEEPKEKAVAQPAEPVAPAEVTVATTSPADPFSGIKVTSPVTDPIPAAEPIAAAAGPMDLDTPDLIGSEASAPAPAAALDDEEAIFAGITTVVNATPALHELESGAQPAPESAPKAQPAAQEASVPPPAATQLFRPRAAAPGVTVISRPFVPPVPPKAATDLDEML